MIIGLLQCDHVDAEFRHIAGDYSDMFVNTFKEYAPSLRLKIYDIQAGQYPESLDECDGYISTGSRHSVYEETDWIVCFREFVKFLYENKRKFVGICFGHQMIAEALGGKCEKATNDWGVGAKRVEIIQTKEWMYPNIQHYNLLVSHQDQIVKLPLNGTVLATNEHCAYSMFTIQDLFLGIQGHPEISSEYLAALMSAREERIGKKLIGEAQKSLQLETHQKIIIEWINQFFRFPLTTQ